MYSLFDVHNEENKKAKGLDKYALKSTRQKLYVDVLFNEKIIREKIKVIQSKLYEIGTYKMSKNSLCFFDEKRYILDDGSTGLAWFHKGILKNKPD